MKTRNQIILTCIGLFITVSFIVTVYSYPEQFGLTHPYVIVREGDYSVEGKQELDFFREHVSSTCPYIPKPESATSYDPVDCMWLNTQCPFEGNPKYKKFYDHKGESYVGLVDEFGSLITCDDVIVRTPESESKPSTKSFTIKIPFDQTFQYEDLELYFYDVEDSRCPTDVTCIWEGQVTAMIHVKNQTHKISGYFTPNHSINYITPYNVTLVDIQPHPISTEKPDYVVTLEITKQQ